jgi:hypothetical protein
MQSEETKYGNKLIAAFMGGIKSDVGDNIWRLLIKSNKKPYLISCLRFKYHKDWNWLMPVVKKIFESFIFDVGDGSFLVESHLRKALTNVDIDEIWKSCVEYINYYNDKKSKNG